MYTDSTDTVKPIPHYVDAIICIIKQWNLYLMTTHNLTTVDWSDNSIVNADSYNNYRVGVDFNPDLALSSLTISSKPPATSNPVTK